jgi:N-acetylmuramoyl-L-alanine amidase
VASAIVENVASIRQTAGSGPALAILTVLALADAGLSTATAADDRPFVLAIDPGHGGSNLGAAGPGGAVFEKKITLDVARRLRDRLSADPRIQVVLCRDQDVLVPIRARARCVQAAHADLFLSLHANASPPGVAPGTRRGFEVYVLSPQEIEDDAAVAAAREPDDADAVWAAHRVRNAAARSAKAAYVFEHRLKEAMGPRSSRGIRQRGASLDVLRGTGAPGVLVEIGFLDHPDEAAQLTSAAGQDRLALALARAVVDVGDARSRKH